MNMTERMRLEFNKYACEHGSPPAHLQLTVGEAFELLRELTPRLGATPMQNAELVVVLREQNVLGLRQAFDGSTFMGVKISIVEVTH